MMRLSALSSMLATIPALGVLDVTSAHGQPIVSVLCDPFCAARTIKCNGSYFNCNMPMNSFG